MPAADGFTIDVDQIGRLVSSLEHATERMASANDALKDLTPHDMGSRDIDDAASDFQGRWEYGIDKIGEFTAGVTDGLRTARDTYVEFDSAVAQMFGGSAAPDATGGGGISQTLDGE